MDTETDSKIKKNVISEESAQLQIDAWMEYYGLDFGDIVIEDGEAAAKTLMNTLIRAIMRGELEIDSSDGLTIIQHLKHPTKKTEKITYSGKVSRARLAMDKAGKGQQASMYAFMASMSNLPTSELIRLDGSDVTVFNRIAVVFSMV